MQNKLFGSRAFYRRVLAVGVRIMGQKAITNFVSLLDNVMIGRVGTVEMSGVAIANQLLFVFNLIVFGAVAGAGIFGAQFYGNNDMDGVQHTMRFKLIICTVLTGICIAVLAAFGPQLIGLYLKGEGRIEDAEASLKFGLEYMRVMYIGLIPYAITQAYAATLRETGETLLPMKAGIVAVRVSLTVNYVLIITLVSSSLPLTISSFSGTSAPPGWESSVLPLLRFFPVLWSWPLWSSGRTVIRHGSPISAGFIARCTFPTTFSGTLYGGERHSC